MTNEEKEEYQNEVTRIVDAILELANFTQNYTKRLQVKLSPHAVSFSFPLLFLFLFLGL